ncbi:MAG: DNA starvation/stationary phase protection protein Dps [Myxococcota bacterium]
MYPTKNDLPEKSRAAVTALLQASLSDSVDLMLQAKQAHWNVKGKDFIQLHELFDQVYVEAAGWVDLIAERGVTLGAIVDGTAATAGDKTRLPKYDTTITGGRAHVEALSTALAAFGKEIRANITKADDAGDADTADLFTEVSRATDKQLWFVEAHLGE